MKFNFLLLTLSLLSFGPLVQAENTALETTGYGRFERFQRLVERFKVSGPVDEKASLGDVANYSCTFVTSNNSVGGQSFSWSQQTGYGVYLNQVNGAEQSFALDPDGQLVSVGAQFKDVPRRETKFEDLNFTFRQEASGRLIGVLQGNHFKVSKMKNQLGIDAVLICQRGR